MSDHAGKNLLRLMAAEELSLHQVAQRTHLDERTLRGIARGTHQPHARTLHRLAEGLGVAVDEFFVDPAQLLYRRFDRRTNPVVAEVLQERPESVRGLGRGRLRRAAQPGGNRRAAYPGRRHGRRPGHEPPA